MVGLGLHLVIPTSGKAQKTAFTQWLDRNLVDSGSEEEHDLRAHLRKLPSQHQEFSGFVKQATQLVLSNKSIFQLPTGDQEDGTADSDSFWLYDTWAEHRDLGGSMDGLLPDSIKSTLKWIVQNQPFGALKPYASDRLLNPGLSGWMAERPALANRPIPFLSGISINAP